MTGISYFMSEALKKEYDHYFESATTIYLTRCKWPTFAARTTILATEVFKAKGLFRESASAFIRMTGEVCFRWLMRAFVACCLWFVFCLAVVHTLT